MRTTSALLAISTLLTALPAQSEAAPFRFVPGNSALVMRMAAPAKWKQRFAGTQVAKLADGETMGPALAQLRKSFDAAIEQLRQSGEFDADLVEQLVTKFQGDIILSVQVDFAKLPAAMEDGGPPPVSVVVALSPDGSYDLAGLAKAVEKSAEDHSDGRPIRDLSAGDIKLRVGGTDDMQVSLPTMIDGHLVMLASPQLEQSAAALLASSDRFAVDGQGGQPLFMHMQLGSAMSTLIDFMSTQMDAQGAPFDVAKVMQGLGLGSLESMTMTLDAEGKHATGDLSLQMNGNERGLLAMMAGGTSAPKLLRLVPPGAEEFSVTRFALAPLYDTVSKLWGEFEELAGMDWSEAQTGFAESMKVRLKEDLVDHLGTELLMLSDASAQAEALADADEDDPFAQLAGSCIGIGLRNGKAFATSLETMLRSQGLHASRKTEDYAGNKIYRLPLGGIVEVEYAVTDDVLLLAVGKSEGARQSLRGVLDARTNPAAEGEAPAKVKPLLATMPSGWHSVSATSMSGLLDVFATAFEAGMEESLDGVPDEAEMVLQMLRGLGADMKRLGIETMLSTSYSTANAFRTVMRW